MTTIYETNALNAVDCLEKSVQEAKELLADKSKGFHSLLLSAGNCESEFTYAFIKWDGAENQHGPLPIRERLIVAMRECKKVLEDIIQDERLQAANPGVRKPITDLFEDMGKRIELVDIAMTQPRSAYEIARSKIPTGYTANRS